MHILFFSSYFHPHTSGLVTFPLTLLSHWANQHQVTVLTFRYHQSLPIEQVVNNIHIHRIPYLFTLSKGFISPQSIPAFSSFIDNADLCITNLPNVEGVPFVHLAKRQHKKVIALFHCQVVLGTGSKQKVISSVLNQATKYQLQEADIIVGTTDDYLEKCSLTAPFTDKRQAIYPPIKPANENSNALKSYRSLKGDKVWIGFVGRIAREKGLEYLINALQDLINTKNIDLILVGPKSDEVVGESHYRQSIINSLKQSNISHKLFESVNDEQLTALYQTMDVLVLPSINSTEAFGLVQVEAMLQGTPVIASNLPGVRIPIQKTSMGKLVKPKDSQSLNLAIKEVLDHPNVFINQTTISEVKTTFSYQESLKQYDQILDQS